MNQMGYQHNSYYDQPVEGYMSKFQYVDVFGRLVSTVEAEDGEIYVSLSELKKSDFELYQAGTLPKPGQLKNFDEQILSHFEMYMKMKAIKFMTKYKLSIPQHHINNITNKEINLFKAPVRSVEMDSSGLLKISSSPVSNYNDPKLSRNRMSVDPDESRGYINNKPILKPRSSMSAIRGARSNDQWNPRNGSFAPVDSNSRFSNRSDFSQSCNFDDSSSYGRSNQCSNNSSKENNISFNKRNNNFNPKTNDEDGIRRPPLRGFNSEHRSSIKQSDYSRSRNMHASDNEDNHSVASHSSNSTEMKRLTQMTLNRNTLQKEQDGTYHVQIKECMDESESKVRTVTKPIIQLKNTDEATTSRKETTKPASETKDDHIDTALEKRTVSFVETTQDNACASENLHKIKTEPGVKYDSKVIVDNTLLPNNTIIKPAASLLKSVVEISTDDTGIFECIQKLSENTFIAFVLPNEFSMQLIELESISHECKPDPSFQPSIGDLVAVLNGDTYVRAIILNHSNGKYTCSLPDYGTIISVDKPCPLPDKFKTIPEFSCFCKCSTKALEDITSSAGGNMSLTISIPGKLTVKVDSSEKEHKIEATKWNPFETWKPAATENLSKAPTLPVAEKSGSFDKEIVAEVVYKLQPPVNKLKDKDIVLIAAEQQGCLLLRTKECNMLLKQINTELNSFEGKPFIKPPQAGQLAVASFNDDGLFRVVIESVQGTNATVEYIDYGNSDSVPIRMLFAINKKLAEMENTLIKINLKGFSGNFSEKTLKALEESSAIKEKFTVVSGDNQDEYDLLSTTDQISLSDKLKLLHKPLPTVPKLQVVPKSVSLKADEIVKLSDLPPSKFKLGINEVLCMHTGNMKEGTVSFCLAHEETTELLGAVQEKINEYVASPRKSYKPEIDEVCLAVYAGEWYRACVIDSHTDSFNVCYIDFGNSHTVSESEICKIPNTLTTTEPLAAVCILKDIMPKGTDVIPESLLSKMENDLQESEVYSINVIEVVGGYLIITIPALYDSWKTQGLM